MHIITGLPINVDTELSKAADVQRIYEKQMAAFVIHGRYVNAVATKKNVEGIPLRLGKFTLAE
jgi:hypothetical protein